MTTLRIRHPKGVLKLEIPSGATALWLYEQIAEQLGPLYVDVKTFWLSQDPTNPDTSRLAPSAQTPLNFAHGELLYLQLKKDQTVDNMAGLGSPVSGGMKSVSVDEKLQKQSGMIKRSRDERLCRHGPVGMCEHCQPLEPYDMEYLEKQGVKHLSFYGWLKKLKDSNNSSVPIGSLLETPNYSINLRCPYHVPFPAAVCTKCQPSAIILKRQSFRMVDHVEVGSPRLIDDFLAGWRSNGFQRFGWLIGRYDEYIDRVPLGIKAVVEYIYEPPQDGSIDGFQLLSESQPNSNPSNEYGILPNHMDIFKKLNLQVVGMIYTDLIDDGTGTGQVEHRRSADSFFISSPEVLFIARQQAHHPFQYNNSIKFGSRFVSVVISGEENGGIGLKAYQVSESAVAMEEAHLISATTDPSKMLVRTAAKDLTDTTSVSEDEAPLYVPQVFYKYKNEYGIEVQKAAEPFFPVEYLLVALSEGIPLEPNPLFKSPLSFPPPHLHPSMSNLVEYFRDSLQMSASQLAESNLLSNANLLLFLAEFGLLAGETERTVLCQAIINQGERVHFDALAAFISGSESWQKIIMAITESVAAQIDSNQMNEITGKVVWSCVHCTFVNETVDSREASCEMCGLPRQ